MKEPKEEVIRYLEGKGFVLQEYLNGGLYGNVYKLYELPTHTHWACKLIDKSRFNEKQLGTIETEIKIMEGLSHPNIIPLYKYFRTSNYYILIMELMKGGDLFESLSVKQKFGEEYTKNLIYQLAQGVQFLHSKNISHRDLKLENIMFADDNKLCIKIGDFGLARYIDVPTNLQCGTIEYMAPEILRGQVYDETIDIWSMGCIIFTCLYGAFPFDATTKSEVQQKILNGKFEFYSDTEVSPLAKDLIKKCLTDTRQRLSIDEFCSHPWFEKYNSFKLRISVPLIDFPFPSHFAELAGQRQQHQQDNNLFFRQQPQQQQQLDLFPFALRA